ncbi:hypothetical protein Syun_009192 [Stephania yunnanensis]|uniref:Uncharacterized protein n=1 Tax=Stephania yunnanensis TaxID=152371 RepID=A0AAP0KE22_9MAGN
MTTIVLICSQLNEGTSSELISNKSHLSIFRDLQIPKEVLHRLQPIKGVFDMQAVVKEKEPQTSSRGKAP